MSYFYPVRSVTEDRDLSRAAAERSVILQAQSERQAAARTSDSSLLPTRLLHYLRTRRTSRTAPRRLVAPEPTTASMVK
jgi:hypothetical protein